MILKIIFGLISNYLLPVYKNTVDFFLYSQYSEFYFFIFYHSPYFLLLHLHHLINKMVKMNILIKKNIYIFLHFTVKCDGSYIIVIFLYSFRLMNEYLLFLVCWRCYHYNFLKNQLILSCKYSFYIVTMENYIDWFSKILNQTYNSGKN